MQNSVISNKLCKAYPLPKGRGNFYAVKELDFALAQGEVVAFLGPNGAGKSTTIKMLCGILTPSTGHAAILGYTAGTKEANLNLGLVFGTRSQLYMHMTVEQSLDLIAEIYFLRGADKRERIRVLSKKFEIDQHFRSRVRTLSLGERMRCEIVASLLHRPRVLLADEPTIGLDIVAKNRLRSVIREWQKSEGTTLMLTSHDLSDVEALCERCILIDRGEKQFDGPLRDLKGELADLRRIHVTVPSEAIALSANASFENTHQNGYIHQYELRTRKVPVNRAIQLLSDHYGEQMQDLQVSEVTLEEVLAKKFHREPTL